MPTRGLLAVETMHAIVQWLAEYQKKYDVNFCKQETSLNYLQDRKYAAKVGQDNVNIGVVTIFRLAKTSLLQVY